MINVLSEGYFSPGFESPGFAYIMQPIAFPVIIALTLVIAIYPNNKIKTKITIIASLALTSAALLTYSHIEGSKISEHNEIKASEVNTKIKDFVNEKYSLSLLEDIYSLHERRYAVIVGEQPAIDANGEKVKVTLDIDNEKNDITVYIGGREAPKANH